MFGRIKLFAGLPSAKQIAAAEKQGLLDANSQLHIERSAMARENVALRDKNEELLLELEMSDDLLTDAARVANARGETLLAVRDTINGVNSPNGTTRKLARIVAPAIEDMAAKTLDQMPAGDVFILEGVRG